MVSLAFTSRNAVGRFAVSCARIAPATPDHSVHHHVCRSPADVPLARLVDAARAGCPGAWRAVVERFDDGLHAIARGYGLDAATVDDAVQATWLSAVTHLAALREPAALSGWLRSILHRECLKAANRARREIPVVEQHLGGPVSADHVALRGAAPRPPEDEAIRRADLAALRGASRSCARCWPGESAGRPSPVIPRVRSGTAERISARSLGAASLLPCPR